MGEYILCHATIFHAAIFSKTESLCACRALNTNTVEWPKTQQKKSKHLKYLNTSITGITYIHITISVNSYANGRVQFSFLSSFHAKWMKMVTIWCENWYLTLSLFDYIEKLPVVVKADTTWRLHSLYFWMTCPSVRTWTRWIPLSATYKVPFSSVVRSIG